MITEQIIRAFARPTASGRVRSPPPRPPWAPGVLEPSPPDLYASWVWRLTSIRSLYKGVLEDRRGVLETFAAVCSAMFLTISKWFLVGISKLTFLIRAERSKFELQPLSGHNSAHRAATELRIELPKSLLHARGCEIGFRAYFFIHFKVYFFSGPFFAGGRAFRRTRSSLLA